jgi:hypothetical protein
MIHDPDMPMCLWVKTCSTTIYILNKCPCRILKDKTPEEAFTVRNHRNHAFMFLVVLCIFIFLMRRDLSLNLIA